MKIRQFIAKIRWRYFFADLTARITYSFLTGMVIELLSGMSFKQMLLSRATNMPVVMVTARVYGLGIDRILEKAGATREKTLLRWAAINMVCYAVFFTPQYAAMQRYVVGVPLEVIIKTCGSVALFSLLLGVVFGYWLGWFRHKLFRIEKQAEKPLPVKGQNN